MKFPIAWHEESLSNMEATLSRMNERLSREVEEVRRVTDRVIKYREQIAVAKQRGIDGFDSDKFLRRKP